MRFRQRAEGESAGRGVRARVSVCGVWDAERGLLVSKWGAERKG